MTKKIIAALGLVLLLAVGTSILLNKTEDVKINSELHRIDLVASVQSINADTNWLQSSGKTQAGVRLYLDDLRTISILDGTMVDTYNNFPACTDFTTPNACVLLADMLGDAVVWFALVPADVKDGQKFLTLPGLVDMQANGDEGILQNGWVVKLATPVVRQCAERDTASLRDFINQFSGAKSNATLDLILDNVVRVNCVK